DGPASSFSFAYGPVVAWRADRSLPLLDTWPSASSDERNWPRLAPSRNPASFHLPQYRLDGHGVVRLAQHYRSRHGRDMTIAGGEHHGQIGAQRARLQGQLLARHAGKTHIRDEQIERRG